MDSSIYGTWFWRDENKSGYVHIGLDGGSNLLRVIMTDFNHRDGKLNVSEFSGHTSSLAGNKYLNLKLVRPGSEIHGYLLVKYESTEKALGISIMESEATAKAIEAGFLKGEVKKGNWSYSVHITEEQNKLQQFVLKNDRELFKKKSHFHRLDLPIKSPQPAAGAEAGAQR